MKTKSESEQTEFLSWHILPARLDATHTAWFLGFTLREIPILVAANLLKPLGHPARNSPKFFATEALEQIRHDEKWLARASDAISDHWREHNGRKRNCRRGNKECGRVNQPSGLNGRTNPAQATATE